MKTKDEIFSALTEIFRRELGDRKLEITETSSPNNVQDWNSINNIVLINEIEKEFNISFSIDAIFKMETVGDIYKNVIELTKQD
jgi:acyl carrier protein